MNELLYQALWDTYIYLGIGYTRRGLYARAERILESALNDAENLSEMDPRLVGLVHVLAGHYQAQGRPTHAKRLYRHIIAVQEKVLGANHPDVANSLEHVALFLLAEDASKLARELATVPDRELQTA